MSYELKHPYCPKCGYDLTGVVIDNTPVRCPECSVFTAFAEATQVISRWGSVRRSLIMLLVVPLVIATLSYVLYSNWEYGNDVLFILGYIPVVFTLLFVLVAGMVLLVTEVVVRVKNKHSRIKPSVSLMFACIVISTTISSVACIFVIATWAAAMASV